MCIYNGIDWKHQKIHDYWAGVKYEFFIVYDINNNDKIKCKYKKYDAIDCKRLKLIKRQWYVIDINELYGRYIIKQ
jgi:hypothetical protein